MVTPTTTRGKIGILVDQITSPGDLCRSPLSPSQCSMTLDDIFSKPSPSKGNATSPTKKNDFSISANHKSLFRKHSSALFVEWEDENDSKTKKKGVADYWKYVKSIYRQNEVFVLMVLAIALAKAYPPLGAVYLYPDITSTWIAVVFIFILAGLGLRSDQFTKAFQQFKFNLFVQMFSFFVISLYVFGVTRALIHSNAVEESLANGMVICACLPMTISSVIVLTKASGGDEATAVFNSAFGSMLSVFLSPALILAYLGGVSHTTGKSINVLEVCNKLVFRVVMPVVLGQILQKKSQWAIEFVAKYQRFFRSAQIYSVVRVQNARLESNQIGYSTN